MVVAHAANQAYADILRITSFDNAL